MNWKLPAIHNTKVYSKISKPTMYEALLQCIIYPIISEN